MMAVILPVPADAITCGLRTDVPKKMRRHLWANLGLDPRHLGDGSIADMRVLACVRCGADRYIDPAQDGPWMRQTWVMPLARLGISPGLAWLYLTGREGKGRGRPGEDG